MFRGIVDHNGKLIRADNWFNPVTGYGGVDDNMENTMFLPSKLLQQAELDDLYESNWVVGRGVELPVNDRLSKGIDFLTNDDDTDNRRKEVEDLEQIIKDTKMWSHLITGQYWGRLFGGAIIYFDYGDDTQVGTASFNDGTLGTKTLSFELPDSQRGIPNKIWVVDRFYATPLSYYTPGVHGADHPKLGEPEIYQLTIQTTGYSRLALAHESRCIVIDGLPISTRKRAQNHMWGNSVVQRVHDICKFFGVSLKAMADTFEDFNFKSLEMENLTKLIEKGSAEVIATAAALAAKNAHNQNIGIHAPGTKLVKSTTSVAGLPEMALLNSNFLAGAWGIPDSRFFSAKGGALGGSAAQSDERNYFQRLRHEQTHIDRPHIERFLFLLGFEPGNFPFVFPPLSEATQLEEIETRDRQAEVDIKYIQNGVLLPEEVAVSRFSTPETKLNQTIVDFEAREQMTDDEENLEKAPDKEPVGFESDPKKEERKSDDTEKEEETKEDNRADTAIEKSLIKVKIKENIIKYQSDNNPVYKVIVKGTE